MVAAASTAASRTSSTTAVWGEPHTRTNRDDVDTSPSHRTGTTGFMDHSVGQACVDAGLVNQDLNRNS